MNLSSLNAFLKDRLSVDTGGALTGDLLQVAKVAKAVSDEALKVHGTDGDKAQAVADELLAVLSPLFPELSPAVLAVLQVGEKYLGRLVDTIEYRFSPAAPALDAQGGPAVAPPGE